MEIVNNGNGVTKVVLTIDDRIPSEREMDQKYGKGNWAIQLEYEVVANRGRNNRIAKGAYMKKDKIGPVIMLLLASFINLRICFSKGPVYYQGYDFTYFKIPGLIMGIIFFIGAVLVLFSKRKE